MHGAATLARRCEPDVSGVFGLRRDQHAGFDGDGKCDVAVWRPSKGQWYIKLDIAASTMTKAARTTGRHAGGGQIAAGNGGSWQVVAGK